MDKKDNHLIDACFQKYVLQNCGYNISKVSIIHLNKDYVRQGEIEISELLKITDVTEELEVLYPEVVNGINGALKFINKKTINHSDCVCRYNTRSNHGDCFSYFNYDIPEFSIYEIARISAKKIGELVELNNTSMLDIPSGFQLNPKQIGQVESFKQKQPVVNESVIKNKLSKLKYPLHFVDYETYASAVPKVNSMSPHKHLVFQVSLHTLNAQGELNHFEWLGDSLELPSIMLSEMRDFTGLDGTFISWNAPFEKGRNKDMMVWMPEFVEYLNYMNENMWDLMEVFKEDYTDYRFRGSTSIKKVLPVICPELSYVDLEVQDGTMALDTWGRMVNDPSFREDIQQTRKNLLDYCRLDTLAMVEIFKFLNII